MSSPRRTASGSPVRTIAIIAITFFTGLAARGFLLPTDTSQRAGETTGTPGSPTSAYGPGPRSFTDGIPAGFAHTEAGARAAAISYALAGQRLVELVPTRVPAAVTSMAASGSAKTQVAEAEEQLHRLRATLVDGTGPTRYIQAVLASRVDAFTPERSRVSVWSVGVLSRTGVVQPQAGWSISTFELVWEHDDWRTWSETISPGPAPALNAAVAPASTDQLDQALLGFTPWRADQ